MITEGEGAEAGRPRVSRVAVAQGLRVVLAGRDFRRLLVTRLASQAGDGVFQVALASLFFFSPERQATAGQIALAFAVLVLPYSLAGPFAGVLLDRWPRRMILVNANLVRAGLTTVVAALILADPPGLPLYAAVLACVSVNRFLLAGLSASLPHVVPHSQLVTANALSPTAGTVAAIGGGGLGFGLRPLLGDGAAGDARLVLVAGAVFAAAALSAGRMHPDLLGPLAASHPTTTAAHRVGQVLTGLIGGAHHLWQRRPAAYALAVVTASRFCYGLSVVAAILLHRNYLHDPADVAAGLAGLASAAAAGGVGFLLAAVVTPAAVRRLGLHAWMRICLLLAAGTEAVFVVRLTEPLLLAGSFVTGLAVQGVKISVDTVVQHTVDDSFRGRIFSLYDVLFNVAFVAAAAVAAATLPSSGYSSTLFGCVALGYAASAVGHGWAARGQNELLPAG